MAVVSTYFTWLYCKFSRDSTHQSQSLLPNIVQFLSDIVAGRTLETDWEGPAQSSQYRRLESRDNTGHTAHSSPVQSFLAKLIKIYLPHLWHQRNMTLYEQFWQWISAYIKLQLENYREQVLQHTTSNLSRPHDILLIGNKLVEI